MIDWDFLTRMAWAIYGIIFILGVFVGWLVRGWMGP